MEAGETRRDSPEEVMAGAVEVIMMDLDSAEREDSGLVVEPHEDAEVLGVVEVAEVATLEVVSVEVRATVLVAVGLEEADLEGEASVEEGALVEIHSVKAVSAEIAIILGMMMVPELSEAEVDLGASVTTNLVGEVELSVAKMRRARRSSSR